MDVTDLRQAEARLHKAAHTDELTGVHNRKAFMQHLEDLCLRVQRQHVPFALLALDLDGFKCVNDTFGHSAGDYVLNVVTQRFLDVVRETDYVARIGGDEFMILLEGVADSENCRHVAEKIITAVRDPIALPDDIIVFVGVSIGVKICRDGDISTDSLIDGADQALYCAKNSGKNRVCFESEI